MKAFLILFVMISGGLSFLFYRVRNNLKNKILEFDKYKEETAKHITAIEDKNKKISGDIRKANASLNKKVIELDESKAELDKANVSLKKMKAENKQISDEMYKIENTLKKKEVELNKNKAEYKSSIIDKDKKINDYKNILSVINKFPENNHNREALEQLFSIYRDVKKTSANANISNLKQIEQFHDIIKGIEDAVQFPIFYHKNIVALCGRFSSGKTSIINSVLGENILPTSLTPTTAINTFVVADKEDGFFVRNLHSGKTKIEKEFYDFITHDFEKEYGMSMKQMLKYVSLYRKNLPYPNIALLDTPGYDNDKTESDRQIMEDGLKLASHLLFIVSIEEGGLTNSDFDFLSQDILKDKQIAIVLNKADSKTETDIKRILDKNNQQLEIEGFENIEIIIYSTMTHSKYYDIGKKQLHKFFNNAHNYKSDEKGYEEQLKIIFDEFKNECEKIEKEYSKYIGLINEYSIQDESKYKKLLEDTKEKRNKIKNSVAEFEKFRLSSLDKYKIAMSK